MSGAVTTQEVLRRALPAGVQEAAQETAPVANADGLRPLRADAVRNRNLLLRAALQAFTTHGPDIALQEIAAGAGVGIGTLYRHFPDREALVEAVYRRTVVDLCAEADLLLTRTMADAALEAWLARFVEHVREHKPMTVVLKRACEPDNRPPHDADDAVPMPPLFVDTRVMLTAAIRRLLTAAAATGSIRGDAEPNDLLRAVGGLCQVQATPAQATRVIGLLVDGLRYGAPIRLH